MNRMKQRYEFLDMLRGVALLGIIGVNAYDITRVGDDHVASSHYMDGRMFLDFGVQCRFVPIFAILFGATMWFIADGARRRGRAGWSALLLRMVALGAIGVLHSLLYSGDILREYAIVGAVLVPCAVWLSPWISLVVGAVLTGVSFGFVGGGLDSLPGLMLLGMGVAGVGAAAAVDRGSRWIWPALVVAIAASSALEVGAWRCSLEFAVTLRANGIDHTDGFHLIGTHQWAYWEQDLAPAWYTVSRSLY